MVQSLDFQRWGIYTKQSTLNIEGAYVHIYTDVFYDLENAMARRLMKSSF